LLDAHAKRGKPPVALSHLLKPFDSYLAGPTGVGSFYDSDRAVADRLAALVASTDLSKKLLSASAWDDR